MAFLGVGIAGAELIGDLEAAVLHAGVGFIGVEGRHLHAFDGQTGGIEHVHMRAQRGQLELGVIGLAQLVLIIIVAVDDHAFAGLQELRRENELGLVGAVGQGDVFQADGLGGGVGDFNPVAEGAVFIREGGFVGGHDLADDQPLIAARARALGVHGLLHRLERAQQQHKHGERNKNNQHRRAKIPPFDAAAGTLAVASNLRHGNLLWRQKCYKNIITHNRSIAPVISCQKCRFYINFMGQTASRSDGRESALSPGIPCPRRA